jgi:hypothetical protein
MHKAKNSDRAAGPQPDVFKLRRLGVKFGNACMRVATPDRRKVMRLAAPDRQRVKQILEQFTFGNITTGSNRGTRSKDDIKRCYLQLHSISPKIANDFRRWAADLLKAEHDYRLAAMSYIAAMVRRRRAKEH